MRESFIQINYSDHIKNNKKAYYTQSILFIVLGGIMLIIPSTAAIGLNIIISAILMLSGILYFAYTWQGRNWKHLVPAGLITLVGLFMLVNPYSGAAALALILAVYFLFAGIVELFLGLDLRGVSHSSFLVFSGALSFILFFVIIFGFPHLSVMVLGIILGIKCIMFGVTSLMLVRNI